MAEKTFAGYGAGGSSDGPDLVTRYGIKSIKQILEVHLPF